MMSTFEKRYQNCYDGPHMNLEGISKAQRGEKCPPPLVHTIARVPLPLQKVSIRRLLWKTLILGLSIFHHSGHLLTPATKPNTWVYAYLSIALIHTDTTPLSPQYTVFSTYIISPLSHLHLFLPFSYALSIGWQCKRCTGDIVGWDREGTLVS